MPALEAVRSATRSSHTRLENHLKVNSPGAGRSELVTYLRRLHGWIVPHDDWVWRRPWPTSLEPTLRLRKQAWLRRDLRALGAAPVGSPEAIAHVVPGCEDEHLALLGAAYVIEGSMLGGRVLARRFESRLEFRPRFFQGYGVRTGPLWAALVDAMERAADTSVRRRQLASAAQAAFEDISRWMRSGADTWVACA